MLDEKLILKICSFLIIWMEIGKGIIIDINEQEAYMMIEFWANCNHEQCISMEKGFQVVNELLEKNNKEQMKEKEYQKTIDNLIKICDIDVVENNIYLKEKIVINYE